MRFLSACGSPLISQLCAILCVGEACALASVIYFILLMVLLGYTILKKTSIAIQRRYLIIILSTSWIIFFLLYGIPFITNYSRFLLPVTTSNMTSYCTTYTTSIYHPLWMSYTEIGMIYFVPFFLIFLGLCFLISQRGLPKLDFIQRQSYLEQKQMTWYVVILSLTFLSSWLPWIIIRVVFIFQNTKQVQRALKITYYILILKSVFFPLLYASTNSFSRGLFAIYRHKRITTNNRLWTVDGNLP